MIIVLDDWIDKKLQDFLLTQEGITDIIINNDSPYTELVIKYNNKINPKIIMKYIELFQNYKYSTMVGFDKNYTGKFKTLKYVVEDICCDHCYKGLVMDLFDNELVKSVKSNYDFNKPAYNIEFVIEYFENYNKFELIKYINDNL